MTSLIQGVATHPADLRREVDAFARRHAGLSRAALAKRWASSCVGIYAAQGAATAVLGTIPGLGA